MEERLVLTVLIGIGIGIVIVRLLGGYSTYEEKLFWCFCFEMQGLLKGGHF